MGHSRASIRFDVYSRSFAMTQLPHSEAQRFIVSVRAACPPRKKISFVLLFHGTIEKVSPTVRRAEAISETEMSFAARSSRSQIEISSAIRSCTEGTP